LWGWLGVLGLGVGGFGGWVVGGGGGGGGCGVGGFLGLFGVGEKRFLKV